MESILKSMESIPHSMESIPHVMESIFKKYGVHPQVHGIHLKNVWSPSPIPWIPSEISGVHPPFHGFHMDYPREGKVQSWNSPHVWAKHHLRVVTVFGVQLWNCHRLQILRYTSSWILGVIVPVIRKVDPGLWAGRTKKSHLPWDWRSTFVTKSKSSQFGKMTVLSTNPN